MAGFRVVRLIPGIGPATACRLLDSMQAAPDPIDALAAFEAPHSAIDDWLALVDLYGRLGRGQREWPAQMEMVTRWYEPHLLRVYEDAGSRQADLAMLQQIAATYDSRERFLTEVTLDPPAATSAEAAMPGLDDDYLVLSTIHSAKGQEWKSVHVLNVVDGCIPSDMSTGTTAEIDEERRLLYVAMTRARDHLHLMVPQRFYVSQQALYGDRHVYAQRSRFIPDSVTSYFELRVWPESPLAGQQGSPAGPDHTRQVDIGARVRALWLPRGES